MHVSCVLADAARSYLILEAAYLLLNMKGLNLSISCVVSIKQHMEMSLSYRARFTRQLCKYVSSPHPHDPMPAAAEPFSVHVLHMCTRHIGIHPKPKITFLPMAVLHNLKANVKSTNDTCKA